MPHTRAPSPVRGQPPEHHLIACGTFRKNQLDISTVPNPRLSEQSRSKEEPPAAATPPDLPAPPLQFRGTGDAQVRYR